jgi:hypothetical protein
MLDMPRQCWPDGRRDGPSTVVATSREAIRCISEFGRGSALIAVMATQIHSSEMRKLIRLA